MRRPYTDPAALKRSRFKPRLAVMTRHAKRLQVVQVKTGTTGLDGLDVVDNRGSHQLIERLACHAKRVALEKRRARRAPLHRTVKPQFRVKPRPRPAIVPMLLRAVSAAESRGRDHFCAARLAAWSRRTDWHVTPPTQINLTWGRQLHRLRLCKSAHRKTKPRWSHDCGRNFFK